VLDTELHLKGLDDWNNGEEVDIITENIYIAIIYGAVQAYSLDHLISKQISCIYKSLKKTLENKTRLLRKECCPKGC